MKNNPTQLTIKPAQLGSISHGTLRTEDLLTAFADELEYQLRRNAAYFSLPEHQETSHKLNSLRLDGVNCFGFNSEEIDPEKEAEAQELINDMQDAISEHFAPRYCSFGAHERDGSDFGYWPNHDEIDDLPQIEDNTPEAIAAEQSENFSTDVRYVNDHGNVTVYGADGSVILELV